MDMIAYCGLDCGTCPAHIAWKNDDQALREKTAKEWQEAHDPGITPDDINCSGCKGTEIQFSWCSDGCPIRKCAVQREVITCGHCGDYPCETLGFIIDTVPEAKQRLDGMAGG